MSNLLVSPKWNSFINKVDAGEEITGGDLGNANIATRQLAENVMFLRDSMFTLTTDVTGDLSQAMEESNKKTKDEFDIVAGLIAAQNEIIIAEAKARKEAISASNTKIAEEAAARLQELGVQSVALQKEIDNRKEAFRLENLSRAESEAKFTEDLEEVLTEAEASVKKVENLSSQLIGGYDGSNLDFVTEGLLFQQKTVTSTAIKGMAEQISMLSAGVGEQFDTAEIWHFDKDKEDWINGVFDVGYLTVKSETVTSPNFLVDGDVYHHLKMRINKVGTPNWAGKLVWNSGSISLPEPVFVDDVTLVTLDTTWSGDITQLQLKLSTDADDTNYYKIDWITIGRPSPGASTASVLDLKIATATRDEALAQDIRGLSTKMDTDNALLSSNVNAKLETITTQQQTQATDITTLSSNVDTMNTKLSADIVLVNSTLVTKETALAESIAALTSKTNESETSVLTQLQTLTDIDSALGTQLDALSASFDTAAAGIVAQNLVFTAEDLAQARQISQLVAKVDGNIAEVNTQIETLTDAESANANKFTSISAEFKVLDDKTDASDAEIRVNAADIIEERNARATDVLAQATRIDVLTTEVGENAASATTRINLLSLEDKALAERLDVLVASTDESKANINLRLTALADEDSAFSEQLTQVMSALDDNDSAVHERVTALTTATNAEAEKLTFLTAEVGVNSAEIATTSRTVATHSGAIAEFNTRLTVEYLPKVENIESNILNAVKQTDVQYYLSISESQPLGGEWLTTAPTWEPSKYMFQRMETTYVDGTIKHTPGENGTNISGARGDKGLDGKDGSDGVAGLQGADGKDGLKGPAGKDGESSYTHLAYATSKNGDGFSTGYFETATYIGMYVDNIKEDSEDYALYNWSLIKGADGTNGIPGPKGTDGKTSYLHIAYANSPDGAEGFSTTASIGKTYIGQYTDFKLEDSDSYTLYSWTLIKGEKGDQGPIGLTGLEGPKGDKGIQGPMGPRGPIGPEGLRGLTGLEGLQGDQGIPGEKGEDGLSSYTHIAYATSVTGTNFNTGHFEAATYIGMYVDNEKTDSIVPSTYKWSLIKGADGANGIAGPKGTDGKTSYLHIAYAINVTGNIGFSTTISEGKTHIGQYTDFKLEDSDDYRKYKWALIRGDKGDTGPAGLPGVPGIEGKAGADGIQGPKGADGTSSYTHLAYATSVTGTNFNTAWYPTATYIGMYVDRTEEDSEVPSKYNWSLIKGADGANGIPGPKGTDGKTTYLHIAYANSEAGDVGFSTTVSAGKTYIGQYTDTTLADSEDYKIYAWSLIKGADGVSSYAHLAYATSDDGTNFNTDHFQGATYIGMYVDNEEDDSTDYKKYNWSLIKGADGANGIPGPTGEDGKTSYLHVAYATSATGAVGFSTTVSEGKTYIGQYTDFEKADSPSYTKYKWSLIKGDKGDKGDQGIRGPIGLTGLEGPVGTTGIQGPKGANGLNSYTHIAYATSADGLDFSTGHFDGATYIGMYVDSTEEDSDVYSKYNWSLIKGADGDKGIPGPTGTDGKTAYLHIAYATSATGNTGFSTTVSAGKTYIGQYTDNELTDSPTYTRYKWTLIKGDKGAKGDRGIQGPIGLTGLTGLEGEKGDQGIQGPVGANGLNSYTHLAYATSANGALFSKDWFEAATYIGMYVDNTETDSSSPSAYNWSLIKGADGSQGIPGPKGTDGKTSYLHIAYATSPTGDTGFSTTISDGKTYIGQYTDFEKVDSGSYTKYKWSLIKGEKGDQGPIGLTGLEGPKGDRGIQGLKGDRGPIGLAGLPGLEGAKGDQGIQGTKGANGLNSYTHLAYATGPAGEGIQTEWYADATYIGMYVDNEKTDSTVASKYKWSLIKGADGANGIAGPKGTDGKTAFLHIAYATSANGVDGFSTTVSTGKIYIGQYTDNTLTDSEVPSKYKWTLIKGADGLNSYTHIAYATGPLGQGIRPESFEAATYIGMYVDNTKTDSIIASDYNWSLIKGADGAQGIPGKAGADGLKTYLHIAYATSANGAIGFSTTISDGKTYIGQYTDNTLEDSVTYSKYKWSLIKGDKGDKGDQGPVGLRGLTGLEGAKGAQGIQGQKGANGLNSYTHLAYATSVSGNEFSVNHFPAATYIGMYVDNEKTDSTVASKYKWSLIKGADGANGIAGPKGPDGKTAYLHIAYATSANGADGFSTTVSTGKTYIGQYTDNELVDSPSYTKYKWTLIKGEKGDQGIQGPIGLTGITGLEGPKGDKGIQGPKGDQGIQGPIGLTGLTGLEGAKGDQGIQGAKGVDGLNSYTHIAYATGPAGQGIKTVWFESATYIGMYVDNDKTDSATASKYKWSLIKGADGANGIAGPTGADGKTAYLHIAYATSSNGSDGFSTTVSAGKTYIGQYTDNELVDSPSYTKYKWTLIKGDKGDRGPIGLTGLTGLEGPQGNQGIQGAKGVDGLNSYTHLAYATGPAGQGIKTAWFESATYIGMYVDNDKTDSTDATKYKWSLIKGADGANGIAGPKGTDGKTAYLHIAYATSANGADGFSTTVSDGKTYIGQYTDNALVDSQVYTKYKWSLIKGADGLNSYTHLAYATGPAGQGIKTAWFEAATYIGMYVDNTETDSIIASDYNWSLIKGADGANGIAGPKGADGKTAYLHIAYATSANGSVGFSTTVSAGKTYIGQYTDNELVDSQVYTKYKWTLIKGDKGDQGIQGPIGLTGITGLEGPKGDKGIQGPKGDQGIQGPIGLTGLTGLEGEKGDQGIQGPVGANGLNSYTHIAYATGPLGQGIKTAWFEAATYIGMYVDNTLTDSTTASKYKWSLIKGADGANGIAGPKGTDGKTAYLHIAYATSANGADGFSTTVSAGKTYIGQYTDNTLTDSPTYTKYKWSLIKGADGLNSYTHLAYATGPAGQGIQTAWFESATYIGMYVDNTETDSTDATKYKWSLIKGADGANGIAGPTGADGKTAYLHIAYATSANGSAGFSTTVSAGKTYIGQYTDNELTDSPTYTKYKWTLIKGDKGDKGDQGPIGLTGVRGLEGEKGNQGIQGPKGVDGLNSYTHLAYATGPAGQGIKTAWFEAATYIGMYVDNDKTDSTVASKYKWSLIKGADGANGIQGPTGTDGKTAYLHIAYATSATGNTGFSTTVSAGKTYIGQYTDNELVDSEVYTKYKWTLIKGDKGDQGIQGIQGPAGLRGLTGLEGAKGAQGIQGQKGANGLNSYTHLAYATGPAGQGIKTAWFEAATYIGMYVDNTETDSGDATKYKWSLIKGADGNHGIAGPKGTDGKTAYLHIAYATSADGSVGFSTSVSAGKAYIGQYTDNELTDSQTYTKYKWTLIKGETGEKGTTGATGAKGPTGSTGPIGQGIDSVTEQYAVSTSKTVAPTTWTTVMPEWSYGLYVWTRSMIKLKNPAATEYTTPLVDSSWEAVNNINVGGRNLLKDSNESVSNNVYSMKSYVLAEAPKVGDDIVITIWGTLGADRTSFVAYNSGGSVSIGTLKLVSPGIYRYAGKWVKGAASDTYLQIYQFANGKTSASTINAIKLEKGNIGTEWSPAPEDTTSAIQGSLDIGNKISKEFGTLKAETKVLTEIGGKISGWKNLNNGATSSFEILADKFSVGNAGVMKKPFSIVGNDITFNGKVSFNSVTGSISSAQIPAGTINLNQLTTADKNKINTAVTQAGTAETNAKKYADLNDKIVVIDSKTKKFLNPSSYSSATASHTGYLVIETPIQSERMVSIDITGYNYQANKSSIALTVSFYITGTAFQNFDYVDTGTYPIENVRLGLKGGKVVIIIGNATSTWAFPKIDVVQAIIGHTASPDTYKDGWVTRIANNTTGITNVVVMNNTYSTSLKSIYTNVYFPATTEINGGNIRTKTIKADSIAANTITGGQIAGNTITGNQIVADTITTREIKVANLSAISANMGSITSGSIKIGSNFNVTTAGVLTASSGNFTGVVNATSGTFKGNVTSSTITSSSINIGGKFKVDTAGNMTATSGTFSGTVSGGSININNKFKVSAAGEVNISSATTGSRLVITDKLISVYDSAGKLRVRLGLW